MHGRVQKVWDLQGKVNGSIIDFDFPKDIGDLRKARFKFRSADDKGTYWEDEAFVRHSRLSNPTEIWCFPFTPRLLYQEPFPPGVSFRASDTRTFRAITKSRFKGGPFYGWNPHNAQQGPAPFPETPRQDDSANVSTFIVTVQEWMTEGFYVKLARENGSAEDWESDSANRVWRPCDGALIWIKSGQANVRRKPLVLTHVPVEVLHPATLQSAPTLDVTDLGENRIPLMRLRANPIRKARCSGSPPTRWTFIAMPLMYSLLQRAPNAPIQRYHASFHRILQM